MSFFTKIFLILLISLITSCGRKSAIIPPNNFQKIDFDKTEE